MISFFEIILFFNLIVRGFSKIQVKQLIQNTYFITIGCFYNHYVGFVLEFKIWRLKVISKLIYYRIFGKYNWRCGLG